MSIFKKFLFLLPVALAVVLFMMAGKGVIPPQAATEKQEKATPVKIIAAKAVNAVPVIRGYGKVQPEYSWEAVAQVAGPVVWMSDKLRSGLLVSKGTVFLRIDEKEYELGLAQIDAQIEALDAKDQTTNASLKIEQRALALLKEDLARKQKLLEQGSTAQASVDAAERAMLTEDARVQALVSTLKVNAAERKVLDSQRAITALNVERTEIAAPFDLRLGDVDIALGQYVNKGQQLFTGDGIAVAEIVAQFPVGALSPLLGKSAESGAPLGTLTEEQKGISDRHEQLKAKILLRTPKGVIEWDAKLDRVSATMDPKTRTRGIILKVDDPYGQATPGQRPPLVRDTAVEVMLQGLAKKNKIALPASAIRQGKVMVADKDKRLRFKPVKPAYIQGDIVVLMSGVAPDEKVIVSDLPAPVDGMLLAPKPDKKLLEYIMAEATGQGNQRREEIVMIRYFAKHPTAANLLMVAILLVGALALPKLQRDTFPVTDPTQVEVRVNYPGASALDVEEAVCLRVEEALGIIPDKQELTCEARENLAIAVVTMFEGRDFDTFYNDIKSEIEAVTGFPDRVERPAVTKMERTATIATIAITGIEDEQGLFAYADKVLSRIQRNKQIAQATMKGFADPLIDVRVSETALRDLGLSITDVANAIKNQSIDLPAGTVETQNGDLVLRYVDQRRKPREFSDIVVKSSTDGGIVRLKDIATIGRVFEYVEDKVTFNGKQAALIEIAKNPQSGYLAGQGAG